MRQGKVEAHVLGYVWMEGRCDRDNSLGWGGGGCTVVNTWVSQGEPKIRRGARDMSHGKAGRGSPRNF